ncbi:MAG: hypothetical protein WCL04_01265 [Verrucomicrobiota bacterium]
MKPKHVVSVALMLCFVGAIGWFWWHAPATAESPDGPGTSKTTEGSMPIAGEVGDFPGADQSVAPQLDPAAMQVVLAAMAELQQQQQAQAAQDAVINRVVTNNLRQLAQGANQYFLERGVSSVASMDLVGSNSTQYIKTFSAVSGETYPPVILQDQPITAAGVAGEREVTLGGPR